MFLQKEMKGVSYLGGGENKQRLEECYRVPRNLLFMRFICI